MNNDLHSGVNDGRLKSLTPSRVGAVDISHASTRASLLQAQYNITDFMSQTAHPVVDGNYESGYADN